MDLQKSDEQLMNEVKQGNLESLAPLFEKYHLQIFNFFNKMVNNRETSEDLTQNLFHRIIKYRETYNDEWLFKTWMYQIARNIAAKNFNKTNSKKDKYEITKNIENTKTAMYDEMEQKAQKEQLLYAFHQLPYHQREILELSRFQNLKYQEIADITGNSVSAIKVKVYRAIKKLRELYFEHA